MSLCSRRRWSKFVVVDTKDAIRNNVSAAQAFSDDVSHFDGAMLRKDQLILAE